MLGHWVGDLHQPLHVSFTDDLGGNLIDKVDGIYGADRRLHGVWDSGIINIVKRRDNLSRLAYARRLLGEITDGERVAWSQGNPVAWAQESYDITLRPATKYCVRTPTSCKSLGRSRHLDKTYQTTNEPKIEQRLKQAGVRLAKPLADEL